MGPQTILRCINSRIAARLPLFGLGLGAIGGALYTLQSAPHMFVEHPADKLIVGLLLAIIGGGIGWLTGHLVQLPLRATDAEPRAETAGSAPENPQTN